MPRGRDAYRQLAPLWYRTGIQDYQNVGSPAEVVEEAGLVPGDTWAVVRQKIKRMLLQDADVEAQVTDHLSPKEKEALTLRQRHALLLNWAKGWADAAIRDLKAAQGDGGELRESEEED